MHETHGCASARKTWAEPYESVVRGKSVRNHPPGDVIVTCVLSVLCVFLRFLSQYSMNPCVYPMGFRRSPFGCSAGPSRRRKGFGTTYGQSCKPVWGKYRACRTHMYWGLLDHAWLSTGAWSAESHLWKLYMLIFQSRAIRPRRGPKIIENRTNPQRGHPPSLIRVFHYALNWQTRAQSFLIRTETSWAHMPFRFCRAQVHISVVTYFHSNSLLACFKQTELKLHVLRQ